MYKEDFKDGDVLGHFQMNSHKMQDFKKYKSVFHRLVAEN